MGDSPTPRAPAGTGAAGRKLWLAIVRDYVLAEHEMVLLRQAVRVADTCEQLQDVVEAEGPLTKTRLGETKTHPALIELRNERLLLSRLCVALRVPIGDQEGGESNKTPSRRTPRRGTRGFYAINGGVG